MRSCSDWCLSIGNITINAPNYSPKLHCLIIHDLYSLEGPTQPVPPGLVQDRLRYCDPLPQVLVHSHQAPQLLHPPDTTRTRKVSEENVSLAPASLSDLQSITSFILFCFSCLSHLPFTGSFSGG